MGNKVLIVDDDDLVRDMLVQMMQRNDCEAHAAADGSSALKLMEHEKCDVVITDIVMPEKEGIEVIMELKRFHPHTGIIAISGGGRLSPDSYLSLARQIGAQYTFSKPVDRTELLTAVNTLLGREPDNHA